VLGFGAWECVGIWRLGVRWDLELGIWDLTFLERQDRYRTKYPSLARTVTSGCETPTTIDRHSLLPATGGFIGL
jgi:hypothetical protein